MINLHLIRLERVAGAKNQNLWLDKNRSVMPHEQVNKTSVFTGTSHKVVPDDISITNYFL